MYTILSKNGGTINKVGNKYLEKSEYKELVKPKKNLVMKGRIRDEISGKYKKG